MAHFSFASLFQIGLLLVFICWTKESTGAAFSLEEEFKQLKENYIQMKEIARNLEAKDVQMRDKVANLENTVTELKATVAQQDSLLSDLLREKNERTAANHFESASINSNQSAVAINGLPSSCSDLKVIGHIWSGFYSIVGSAMMESVYCDFSKLPSDPGFQKWIGYNDVKSAPVYFYVQRNDSFPGNFVYTEVYTKIPFDLARVNEGNAMDLATGIFTAPRPGTYFFTFTGLAAFPTSSSSRLSLHVSLKLKGYSVIGSGVAEEANIVENQRSQLTLQSTLKLKKGDQVSLEIVNDSSYLGKLRPYLRDDSWQHTNFMGFLLEEEIVASL